MWTKKRILINLNFFRYLSLRAINLGRLFFFETWDKMYIVEKTGEKCGREERKNEVKKERKNTETVRVEEKCNGVGG